MSLMQKTKYAVPALDKAFEIFEFLADNPSPKTQAEIAQGVGRSTNEIYRILVNLEQNNYLNRNPLSGRYYLSLKLYNLSRSISPADQIRQCAIPIMDDLAAQTGLSCYLSVLQQSKTMVLIHSKSPSPLSLNIAEGSIFSTLQANAGLLLLANSNSEVRELILQRDTLFSAYHDTQKQTLYDQLDIIKHQGYQQANSHLSPNIYEYATLIGQPEGKVVAALTLCAFEHQLDQNRQKLPDTVKEATRMAAQHISQQLALMLTHTIDTP
ncbi:IclR family transcriptional regulator [Marinomonas agarivorans]|nr:IclR family transcriptional regulator [Marinomonas agarivorans]